MKNDENKNTSFVCYSNPHGRVDVAIEFSKQIYNFKGHKVDGKYIFNSNDYCLFSFHDHILGSDSLFNTRDVELTLGDEAGILLEKYAYDWILNPNRKLADFDSKDFLEQVCITHSIWRTRDMNDSLGPYNEIRKKYYEEDMKVETAILKILEPKIEELSKRFKSRYKQLEYGDIYSQASTNTLIMFAGENSDHIKNLNAFIHKNPEEKQNARKRYREYSVHALKTHRNSDQKNIDLQSIKKGALEKIFSVSKSLSERYGLESGVENFLMMVEPKAFASFESRTINYNSERIYKPWFEENLPDFIFGKKQRLWNRLRDHFKSEIKKEGKKVSINNIFNESEDYQDNNTINDFDSYDYGVETTPRRWKQYTEHKEINPEHQTFIDKLPKKQKMAYMAYVSGNYNSTDVKERQNLLKAKRKLLDMGLNAEQIPLPKSQKQ